MGSQGAPKRGQGTPRRRRSREGQPRRREARPGHLNAKQRDSQGGARRALGSKGEQSVRRAQARGKRDETLRFYWVCGRFAAQARAHPLDALSQVASEARAHQ